MKCRGLEGGLPGESTDGSSRELGFNHQHPHGGSQRAVAPVPGYLTPFSGPGEYYMQVVHRPASRPYKFKTPDVEFPLCAVNML